MIPKGYTHVPAYQAATLRPIIVVGAARSGTKFLRRLLAAHPACAFVPYGIPMVWRTGNEAAPHDALPASACTPTIAAAIRSNVAALAWASRPSQARLLIEKTCANTLRVPFVQQVYPEARVIHLVRDGRDVVPSAYRRWHAAVSWKYRFRKAAFLPTKTVLRQGLRAVKLRLFSRFGGARWGPHYPGMGSDVQTGDLRRVCVNQWRACVTRTLDALEHVPRERVLSLRYEALVSDPACVDRLAAFLRLPSADALHAHYTTTVRRDTIGDGRERFAAMPWRPYRDSLRPVLQRLGYRVE